MGFQIFYSCFAPKTRYNANSKSHNASQTNVDTIRKDALQELNTQLNDKLKHLSLSAFISEGSSAVATLPSIYDEICNKEYLNDIKNSPNWNKANGTHFYLILISDNAQQHQAFCNFEISKDYKKCTIHLLCSRYKAPEINNNQLKLGQLLMNGVIDFVKKAYEKLEEIFLIAETDQNNNTKLVDYYKQFGFVPQGEPSNFDTLKQNMRIPIGKLQCTQIAGANKHYVKYQNRKYFVRLGERRKKYILVKGQTLYLKDVKHTKL